MYNDPNVAANEKVDVHFSGISLTLHDKKKGDRILLDNISGTAKAGRLMAIMG